MNDNNSSNSGYDVYFHKCMQKIDEFLQIRNISTLSLSDEKEISEYVSLIHGIISVCGYDSVSLWVTNYNMEETMVFVWFFLIKLYRFKEIRHLAVHIPDSVFFYALPELIFLRGKRASEWSLRRFEEENIYNLTFAVASIINNDESLKVFNNASKHQFNSCEQAKFHVLLPEYKYMNTLKKTKGLSNYQNLLYDEISAFLYNLIVRFLFDTIKRMTKECNFTPEQKSDLNADVKATFFAHLHDYNPLETTPTTFFIPYFTESIRSFIQNSMNMTPYTATNARTLRKLMNEMDMKNESYTLEKLAHKADMTDTVAKNTLDLMRVQTVDYEGLKNTIRSDEESFVDQILENVRDSEIEDMIDKVLTKDEAMIFRLRMSSPANRADRINTYQAVAEISGLSIREVRSTLNRAKKKIINSEMFKRHWGKIYLSSGSSSIDKNVSAVKPDKSRLAETQVAEFFTKKIIK